MTASPIPPSRPTPDLDRPSARTASEVRVVAGDPRRDPRVLPLLEAVFGRGGAESALVERVAREHPDFDGELARLALVDGEPAGWALFMPRALRLAGHFAPTVVSSPFCVAPAHRRRGVARALLGDGLERARRRGACAAVVLGGSEFFRAEGYAPAFRMHSLRVRVDDLPDADESGWRGLRPGDLHGLSALHGLDAADAAAGSAAPDEDGAERRRPVPLEWEAQVPEGQARVLELEGALQAYLRFRVDPELAVCEVAVRDRRAVARVLGLLRALLEAHGREHLELRATPGHPVARALFHRGALALASDLRGAALLRVLDWRSLLRSSAATWDERLAASDGRPISLGIGDRDLWLLPSPLELMVEERREPSRHLQLPEALAPALLTGHRSWRDLVEDPWVLEHSALDDAGWRAVRALFPGGAPDWRWGPVFELADR